MTAEPAQTRAMNLFYCYAHEDRELRDRLEKHLANLKRNGQISAWYDREIRPGQEWKREIDVHLSNAHIILLLVSPDFMASDYCYSVEMKRALERHTEGSAKVIPIILCPVDWEDAPFSKLQVLPTEARPVTSWPDRNEAFLDIVKGIRKVIKELYIEQLLTEGRTLRKSGKFDEALDIIEQVIQLAPDDARAYYERGSAFLDKLSFPQWPETRTAMRQNSLAAFEQAILIDPGHAQAYFGKARILYLLGRYQEALASVDHAIFLNPNKSEIYHCKGAVLERLDKTEEALTAYEQAIRLNPGNIVLFKNKLELLTKLNRHEEALVTLEQIIRLEPDDVSHYRQKGNLLVWLGHYDKALTAYERAIYLCNPSNTSRSYHSELYSSKGDVLYQLKRDEEALAAYEQAIHIDDRVSFPYRGKGKVYERLAQQAYEKADELEGKNS